MESCKTWKFKFNVNNIFDLHSKPKTTKLRQFSNLQRNKFQNFLQMTNYNNVLKTLEKNNNKISTTQLNIHQHLLHHQHKQTFLLVLFRYVQTSVRTAMKYQDVTLTAQGYLCYWGPTLVPSGFKHDLDERVKRKRLMDRLAAEGLGCVMMLCCVLL